MTAEDLCLPSTRTEGVIFSTSSVGSVPYGAGQGGFSLCDPFITPPGGQLFAVPPHPV